MESSSMNRSTPLRYPGGKSKITNYVKVLLKQNSLLDIHYAEPYAGGAGVALSLLFDEYAQHIHINDLDPAIYSFWHSVINHPEEMCRMIDSIDVSMDEWHKQKAVQTNQENHSMLEIGFSTFFLNRTNRSGIILAGVIGGKNQSGKWKLDARFNKEDLKARIRRIALYRKRISLYNMDAQQLIEGQFRSLGPKSLIYLDPPYYVKGQDLYKNYYCHQNHVDIAEAINSIETPWIVSYDNASEISEIYKGKNSIEYCLSYSAAQRYQGTEIMFFSPGLKVPPIKEPTSVSPQMANRYQSFLPFEDMI
ncbi:DNA adenine methylase [Deinococcus multiflagellatus]|uniref:site-specific DNA-methyltransferase (adenine-specific) n=1 Tax=Deinococcus multiflagellatus TaxID=1656887 RepID=A0ABW1ZHY2_9DEIO|nr:DNA adenine methylase [Deinococcus multiflagellatus]MBZ9713731.1 DNA adenine methylase [Deinococcus multiflagellatus]